MSRLTGTVSAMNGDGIIHDTPQELEDRWPALWQKAATAIGELVPPVMACSHVIGGEHPMLCVDHPQAGFLCIECIQEHGGKMHDPERTCDVCGGAFDVDGSGHAVVCGPGPLSPDVRVLRNPAGDRRRLEDFAVMGLGVCSACDARDGATGG